MSELEPPFDLAAYHTAVLSHDWARAIAYGQDLAARQSGGERLRTLIDLADFPAWRRRVGGRARPVRTAWAYAERLGLHTLLDGLLLQCAMTADTLGVSGVAAAALDALREPATTPFSSVHAVRRLAQARANADALAGSPVRVIPIGQECLPYSLLMRWGFAEFAVDGPFLAGVFCGVGPGRAMAEDFAGFLDAGQYRLVRSTNGAALPTLPQYRSTLNHEIGPYFCDETLDRLVELYRARVAAFRQAMASAAPVVLLIERTAISDIAEVMRLADAAYPHAALRFLVLDYEEDAREPDDELAASADPRLRIVRAPRPSPSSFWHHPQWQNSEQGLAWEAPMAAALAALIGQPTWPALSIGQHA